MNPQELRLGNYIDSINRSNKVHLPNNYPIKIVSIGLFKCRFVLAEQNPAQVKEYSIIDNTDTCGIPLTEEWLTKFGFVLSSSSNGYDYYEHPEIRGCYRIMRFKAGNGVIRNSLCIVSDRDASYVPSHKGMFEHVHQLQNLFFALTREELTL